jgi:uncharacterized membrane protein YbhN (UPF0104 family)
MDVSSSKPWSVRHRRALLAGISAAAVIGFVLFVVPQVTGLHDTWEQLRGGHAWWLGAGVASEAVSTAAYVVLFRAVFSTDSGRIGWRASAQITLAGDAATKVFASAGAGGIALTVWALRAAGLQSEAVARGMASFEVMLYGVYMTVLVVLGLALGTGAVDGRAPAALTLAPAAFGAGAIVVALSTLRWGDRWTERLQRRADDSTGRAARWWHRGAEIPGTLADGIRAAWTDVRTNPLAPISAVAYWAFDIGALWASFHAFGGAPTVGPLVLAYFVGMLANALPLPGGLGGVEGGMIGALIGFGVHSGLAVLAVLAYRTISYWLPTLPGVIAYVRLRGTVSAWRMASVPGRPQARGAHASSDGGHARP